MAKTPLFHKGHYNIIAAQIRHRLEQYDDRPVNDLLEPSLRGTRMLIRNELVSLALSMAHRFKEDNSNFKPLLFLTACSPDPDLYPLDELWSDDK